MRAEQSRQTSRREGERARGQRERRDEAKSGFLLVNRQTPGLSSFAGPTKLAVIASAFRQDNDPI